MAPPLRVLEVHVRNYRRTWRASAFSTFANPVLFLLAMGLGLGTLVDRGNGAAALPGLTYLEFLAPGLLAAAAMQTAAGDSSWPVISGMKWLKTYHAALATPISTRDLVYGHLAWVSLKVLVSSLVFVGVMAAFGAARLPGGLVAVLPAVLTGLAFAAPIMAYSGRLTTDYALSALFRFGIVPLFLFSGTFFPVSQLPAGLQPLAVVTPLWHGVQLTRGIALGTPPAWPATLHVAYLLVWAGVGTMLATAVFRRRLVR